MTTAAQLLAKAPALLLLADPAAIAGRVVEAAGDVAAAYEYYTGAWLMAAARERAPQTATSFAQLHR
jgi:hypothetical protein